MEGFPGGASGKEPACKCRLDVRDTGSIPGLGRSPGGGHGNPLQYSGLENPMDRGAWRATFHGVAKSRPGDLPNPGIEPRSPTLQADSLPSEPSGKPIDHGYYQIRYVCSSNNLNHSVVHSLFVSLLLLLLLSHFSPVRLCVTP